MELLELLLMFSTALKDLAVELNVFMMSSTQLNAKGDDSTGIRDEAAISGSRSIINKADVGVIMARPTNEELKIFVGLGDSIPNFIMPNMVTDVYKVRSGQWNQIKIWSYVDLGNLRKEDLFITNGRMEIVDFGSEYRYEESWDEDFSVELMTKLDKINGSTLND